MAKVITGVVKYIADEKRYDNYGLKLVDREEWFNTPNRVKGVLERGYTVKLTVEDNDRGGFNVVKKPVLVKKGTPPAKGGGRFGGRFKQDPEKARNIAVQHSQDVALATVTLLLANGAVKLPAKKPDLIKTVLLELIDEQTARVYAQVFKPELLTDKAAEVEEDLEEETDDAEEESEEGETEEVGDKEESGEIEDDVPWDED